MRERYGCVYHTWLEDVWEGRREWVGRGVIAICQHQPRERERKFGIVSTL